MLTPQWIGTKGGPSRTVRSLDESLRRAGASVVVLSGEAGDGAVSYGSVPLLRELRVLAELIRRRPDVVHIHGRVHLIPPAALYKRFFRRRARLVFTFHTQPYMADFLPGLPPGRPDYTGLRRWLARRLLRLVDEITTVSASIIENLNRRYGLEIAAFTTIPSGADPPEDSPAACGPPAVEADPLLCTVGVLSWDWKVAGHLVAIEAMREIGKSYPGAKLLIAGDGAYRRYLEGELSRLGLSGAVVLLGNIDAVGRLLSRAHVYVHMALNEGCPLAVVEAMMAGKPIIAANRGGIPELIEHMRTGLLIEPEPAALASAVTLLQSSPDLRDRLGRGAAEYARTRLRWDTVASEYLKVYAIREP